MAIDNLDDFIPVIDVDITDEDIRMEPKANEQQKTSEVQSPEEEESDEDFIEDDPFELEEDDDESEEQGEEEKESLQKLPVADEKKTAAATAAVLKEMGLINPEGELTSLDDLEDLLKTQAPQALVTAMVDELPDFGKNLAIFVLSKGADLTKDDLRDFYADFFQDELLESMNFDDDNIEDAKQFLRQEYKAKGMRDSVINKTIDALDLEEELLDEANKLLEERKAQSKSATKATQSMKESQERKIDEVAFIKSVRGEIQSRNWKPERQKKVLDVIANNRIKDVIRDAVDNPKSLVAFANILSYYDFESKDFDLTDFVAKVATAEVEKTKASIFRDAFKSAGSGSSGDGEITKKSKTMFPNGLKPIL